MIDIHSHILPNLDDGSQELHESIEMARAALLDGIHTIIATPHHANGRYHNEAATVLQSVEALNDRLKQEEIGVRILPGQEIRVYPNMIDDWNQLLTLQHSSYVLLELPSNEIPSYFLDLLHELRIMKVTPIIAHPERNQEIAKDPSKLLKFIELGALSQLTSHSITGLFGPKIQSLCFKLCENHLAHFISSDAHNNTRRPFALQEAYSLIQAKLGSEYVSYLQSNAEKVVSNSIIDVHTPLWPKHKWFQFWKSS
ncbi:Tyrosine-protein phosphatase YwqE [compost metagenome]